ncbi:MAG: sigma-E processing peptidase SpoIIGA [Clostridia bacterium]|nr:sigma-E processing peptidase SpoIIGA [Clostridia bacterium]MBQ8792263.1 sigma-E processing peptidase SpoIIGA [Clostridia bacterium]
MKIVVEYTLATSMMAGLLTLSLAGKILKQKVRLKWLSSLLGGGVSLTYPLFHLSPILKILILIFLLVLITLISFKYRNFSTFLRNFLLIFMLTCLFGGICEAIKGIIGEFSLFIVCVILIASFIVAGFVVKGIDRANKIKQFSYRLKIIDNGKEVEEEGYLDSGNVLKDNVTNKPIILVNYEVFHKLYEGVNYISAVTKSYDFKSFKNGHFVPIKGVGGGGKMLVFSVDELQVGDEKFFKDVMVGLSFSGFEKSFGKGVLLNCEMI